MHFIIKTQKNRKNEKFAKIRDLYTQTDRPDAESVGLPLCMFVDLVSWQG